MYHKIQTLDQESLIDSITHYCFLIAVNEVSLPVVKSLIYSKIYEHIAERVAQLQQLLSTKVHVCKVIKLATYYLKYLVLF